MQLSTSKLISWWIALILGVTANLVTISALSGLAFWLMAVGLLLLLFAMVHKDL